MGDQGDKLEREKDHERVATVSWTEEVSNFFSMAFIIYLLLTDYHCLRASHQVA